MRSDGITTRASTEGLAFLSRRSAKEAGAGIVRTARGRRTCEAATDAFVDSATRSPRKDLLSVFGTTARVSEVLSGKRALTLEMIRKLHDKFAIPLESLIASAAPAKKKRARSGRKQPHGHHPTLRRPAVTA
jgi:hypothetical protein